MWWCVAGWTGLVGALIAAQRGGRRHAGREVRRSARMALWLAVACGLLGMTVCFFGREVMLLAGQDRHIAEVSGSFLRVIMWGMIPMIFANVLRSVVSALGRPIYATAITALAVGVSVLGNYAFVFGHFGAPALGLEGSALASALTGGFGFLAYVVAIQADRRLRRYRLFGNWWHTEWQRMRELVRTGLPVAGTIVAEAGLFSGAAFLMGLIDIVQLAGHVLALQVAALAFQVPFGIGQAATIRVGYHFGAGDRAALGRAGWVAIMTGTGFMALTAAIMLFAPKLVLGIYVDTDAPANAALMAFAVQFMIVAAAFQLFDGLQAVAAGALRGLQDTRTPMLFALFGYWLPGMGTSIALGFFTPLEGLGVWIGLAVGLVVVALLMLQRWSRRARLGLLPA
jgi:multidrug resistance protein, MATE family